MNFDKAINIIARASIWTAYETWVEVGWERMPDIGEFDFDSITDEIEEILPKDIDFDEYNDAIVFLEERAKKWKEENPSAY